MSNTDKERNVRFKIDYKFLIENSSDIIFITDKKLRILFLSKSFEELTGYEREKLSGKDLLSFIHRSDKKDLQNCVLSAENSSASVKCIYRLRMKSGNWVYFESVIKDLNSGGKELLMFSTRDVSEKVGLENEMLRKDNIYETILRNFPHGTVTLYDRNFRYLFCDGLELKRVGMTSEHIIGKTIYEVLPEDKADHLKQYLVPSLEDGEEHEFEIENAGRYYKLITLPIKNSNGRINECLAMTQNITDMKNAEQKIRRSEEKLRLAQKVANIGSWEWDLTGKNFSWSDELCKVLGKRRNTKPTFEAYLKCIHPSDRDFVESEIKRSLENKESFSFDSRLITKSGDIKYHHTKGDIIKEDYGKTEKLIGVCYDITEKKKYEDELLDANRKLIKTQNELINNEKLAAIGRVASSMAHEIRNPLANIKASSQIMQNSIDNPQHRKYLEIILKNSDKADGIIKDLLNFSSPKEIELSESDILNVIKEAVKQVKARSRKNDIKIIVHNHLRKIPKLMLNEKKLCEAFVNFLTNSIEAIDKEGRIKIDLNKSRDKSSLISTINDTGSGIEKENINKILEPFFTTKSTGVGLGMSISHQILKMHNAHLSISSTAGKGTELTINFPLPISNLPSKTQKK